MGDMLDGLKKTAEDIVSKMDYKMNDINKTDEQLKSMKADYKNLQSGLDGIVQAIKVYDPDFDSQELIGENKEEPTQQFFHQVNVEHVTDTDTTQAKQAERAKPSNPLWAYTVEVLKAKDNQFSRASEVGKAIKGLPDAPDMVINTASILAAVTRKEEIFEVQKDEESGRVSFRIHPEKVDEL